MLNKKLYIYKMNNNTNSSKLSGQQILSYNLNLEENKEYDTIIKKIKIKYYK